MVLIDGGAAEEKYGSSLPFLARLDRFYVLVKPRVAVDVLIYTPQELESLKRDRVFMQRLLEEGKLVYEEKPD